MSISSSTGLRELNIEARRQRILEAARRLLAHGGMAALSMRKLAREADLSVTTLYNLFGDRDAILRALTMDAIDQMDVVLEREAPLDDPIERCRAIVNVSVRHMVETEDTFRPMAIAAHEAALQGNGSADGEVSRRAARMQARAIRAAIDRGILRPLLDPEQLGRQIYHGFELACSQWALGQIDAERFEARALYGVELALLAVATESVRPEFERELLRLEARLERLAGHRSAGRSATEARG